jgi:hypothetical protein
MPAALCFDGLGVAGVPFYRLATYISEATGHPVPPAPCVYETTRTEDRGLFRAREII